MKNSQKIFFEKYKPFFLALFLIIIFFILLDYCIGFINDIGAIRIDEYNYHKELSPLYTRTKVFGINQKNVQNIKLSADGNVYDSQKNPLKFFTDENGYITVSYNEKLEKSKNKIIFVGGSNTECNAVDENLRFPFLAGQILAKDYNLRFNTLNYGVRGSTTQDSINLLMYLHRYQDPVYIVMMQNDNDLMWLNNCLSYKYYPIDESVNDSILDFIAGQLKYKSNILYLIIYTLEKYNILPTRFPGNQKPADYIIEEINKKRLTAGKNYLFGSFVKQYTENLKIFIEICRICKIRPVLMTQPMCIKNDGIIQFNHVIRDVCKKQKVPLIDLAEAFPSDNDKLFYDKVHFNNEGSKVAAEIIAKRFYEIIISDKIF